MNRWLFDRAFFEGDSVVESAKRFRVDSILFRRRVVHTKVLLLSREIAACKHNAQKASAQGQVEAQGRVEQAGSRFRGYTAVSKLANWSVASASEIANVLSTMQCYENEKRNLLLKIRKAEYNHGKRSRWSQGQKAE